MFTDFQLDWHYGHDWPEWGSAPRLPLVRLDGMHQGEWLDSVAGTDPATGAPCIYQVLRCELCISTHVYPLPSERALAHYYATQFYTVDKPDYVERYERDRAWWEQCVHRPLLTGLQRPEARPRLLDVGAGPGIALDVARQLGWETWGIEPDPALATALAQRGHKGWAGVLSEDRTLPGVCGWLWGQPGSFDVVYAYEVVEHQPCPESFLLACAALLKPGGSLVIVVPNDYNPAQLAARQQLQVPPYWLAPPQHLHYFTPKTLQLLVRRCGFRVEDLRGTYPLDRALTEGENYLGNDTLGRAVHQRRMAEELASLADGTWADREALYRGNLTYYRLGRELVCVARKTL